MKDQYQREIEYLRISLTDRCNLSCGYCRPEIASFVPHKEILRYEELLRICQAAVRLGIRRFRLTGGEPLLRKDCTSFLAQLKQLDGVEQVTLTTNGTLLAPLLPELMTAGLDGVNISLDTAEPERFAELTGGGKLETVLEALAAVRTAGLPLKLNCVPLAPFSLPELLGLLKLAQRYETPLRFIELMPLECNSSLLGVSGAELRSLLEQAGLVLTPDGRRYGNGPASYWRVSGYSVPIGFIEPLHKKFCAACNRVRLTSTGLLRPCLYSDTALNLKRLLRDGADDEALTEAMREMIYAKPLGHHFEKSAAGFQMNEIGG